MRRVGVLVLAIVIVLAGAACDPELSRKASGTFEGTSSFQFGTQGCTFVHQEFEGVWTRREGALGGTFQLSGCVTQSSSGSSFVYDGTFLMVTQGGAELRGTVSGGPVSGNCPAEFDHVLTLTSGTKRYHGATGTIFIDGVWDCTSGPFQGPNPYNGTLTAVIEAEVRTATGARLQL